MNLLLVASNILTINLITETLFRFKVYFISFTYKVNFRSADDFRSFSNAIKVPNYLPIWQTLYLIFKNLPTKLPPIASKEHWLPRIDSYTEICLQICHIIKLEHQRKTLNTDRKGNRISNDRHFTNWIHAVPTTYPNWIVDLQLFSSCFSRNILVRTIESRF